MKQGSNKSTFHGKVSYAFVAMFFTLLALLYLMSRLPIAILGFYLLVSLVTFLSYGLDKRAAKKGKRRTPERRLHLLALAGGWPGAWLAQKYYRHKTQKTEFRFMFWLTVLFNLGALMWMQTADGQRLFVSLF